MGTLVMSLVELEFTHGDLGRHSMDCIDSVDWDRGFAKDKEEEVYY